MPSIAMIRVLVRGFLAAALLQWAAVPAAAISPADYYDSMVGNASLDQEPGEAWAWHAQYGMGHFVKAYQAYGDAEWLDYGVQYYDWVLDHARTAPDGYRGWIGPVPNSGGARTDEHMGDAILTRHMLEFAELVRNDPALHEQFGDRADAYVQFAEVNLIEKWDVRGTYNQIGDVGAYQWWDKTLPEDISEWEPFPERHENDVTQQFNKQTAMGVNALRLWRITGEEAYRDRAVELFGFLKSRMQHYDGAYVWNFRDPAVEADINSVEWNDVKTWMAVHPSNSGYQAAEVRDIVEAYHSGIVFDEQDIERLLKANLEVMWNGDPDEPSFRGSDHAIREGGTTAPGQLWSALADFNETIRDLYQEPGTNAQAQIAYDHFVNVVLAGEPGFDRQYVDEGDPLYMFDWPHGETRYLKTAFLTEPVFEPGEEQTIIGVNSLDRDNLIEIAVFDAFGEEKLLVLDHLSIPNTHGTYLMAWDGTDESGEPLAPGDYRIRWTLEGDGYREYPVTLIPTPASLALLGGGVLLLFGRPRRSRERGGNAHGCNAG